MVKFGAPLTNMKILGDLIEVLSSFLERPLEDGLRNSLAISSRYSGHKLEVVG